MSPPGHLAAGFPEAISGHQSSQNGCAVRVGCGNLGGSVGHGSTILGRPTTVNKSAL